MDELYEEYGFYSEVIEKLKADNTLDEPVRKVALQIANSRLWEDGGKLKKQSGESGRPGRRGSPVEGRRREGNIQYRISNIQVRGQKTEGGGQERMSNIE